jgi:hypothetical protein
MVTTTFGGGGLGGAKAYPQPLMWIAKSAESVVRIPRRKIFGSLPAFSSQIMCAKAGHNSLSSILAPRKRRYFLVSREALLTYVSLEME